MLKSACFYPKDINCCKSALITKMNDTWMDYNKKTQKHTPELIHRYRICFPVSAIIFPLTNRILVFLNKNIKLTLSISAFFGALQLLILRLWQPAPIPRYLKGRWYCYPTGPDPGRIHPGPAISPATTAALP